MVDDLLMYYNTLDLACSSCGYINAYLAHSYYLSFTCHHEDPKTFLQLIDEMDSWIWSLICLIDPRFTWNVPRSC